MWCIEYSVISIKVYVVGIDKYLVMDSNIYIALPASKFIHRIYGNSLQNISG